MQNNIFDPEGMRSRREPPAGASSGASSPARVQNEALLQQEQEILTRLTSDEPDEVRQAAFEAGHMRLKSAIPLLVEHFDNRSVGVQDAADHALRKIRGAETVQALAPLLASESVVIRNTALDILREIGSDDILTLTRLLYDRDTDVRIFVADILGASGSSAALAPLGDALLHDPDVNVRYQAAVSLGELRYPEVTDCLRRAIHDEEWVQYAVMEALAKLKDETCVDILIQALSTASPLVASTILDALGDINSVKAAPVLLQYLEKCSGPLQTKALKALIQILGPNSLSLLGAKQLAALQGYMLAALENEEEDTLQAVLSGLGTTGGNPAATRAVLDLVARTEPDTQPELLQYELQCLVNLGFNEELEKALQSKNELVRCMVIDACGQIPGRAGKYALKRHFDSLPANERQQAIELLAQTGDDRDIPFFTSHLTSVEEPMVLRAALLFLGRRVLHVESAPQMLTFLTHSSTIVRDAALEACLALQDEQTIDSLIAYREHPEADLRRLAVYSMGMVNADYFARYLAQALEDPSPEVRKTAIEAIGFGWAPSPEKLDILVHALQDADREVRINAVSWLRDSGEDAIPALMEALTDEDDWVKVRAIEVLGCYRVREATPTLVAMVQECSILVQLKLIEALGYIGGDDAVRALLSFMSHEDPEIHAAVTDAVAHIRQSDMGRADE